ncbi:MAG: hypothetical protein WD877_02315 [Candidatus Saccharimonadales bacterium]
MHQRVDREVIYFEELETRQETGFIVAAPEQCLAIDCEFLSPKTIAGDKSLPIDQTAEDLGLREGGRQIVMKEISVRGLQAANGLCPYIKHKPNCWRKVK